MRTQTSDGVWTYHSTALCEYGGCGMGDVLIHNETGDRFDISHWTVEDWDDFCDDDHHRESHAEMLERVTP